MANQKLGKSKLRDLLAAEDRLIKAANRLVDYFQLSPAAGSIIDLDDLSPDEITIATDELEVINSAADLLKIRQAIVQVLNEK